ncbi:DUF262 domain-containing protein [Fusobacterium mortiferum]|uniref:DUF262 domain-containing protein n=1 Tax=Fusobacterium mortiferum TaxID=850 RepID=UPI003569D26A
MNIEVNEKAIRTLFSDDFWFNIPSYQRPYVWGKDNITDLLDDIVYAFKYNTQDKYFLGSLVLQEKNKYEYDILDGQQRLTTLCIFMAVLRDLAKDDSLKEALQSLLFVKGNKFKGIKDKARLTFEIRSEVEEFFQECIIKENGTNNIDEFMKANNILLNDISIKNMYKAISTIREFIENNEYDIEFEQEDFFNFIYENLIFAYVCSDTREQAFRLFTILNNRGIPLTTADILKSLNLDKISDEAQRNEYAKKWEELEQKYGERFDRFLNFIRTMKLKEKARKNLLEEFEEKIYKKGMMTYGKESIDYFRTTSDNYDKLITFDINLKELDNHYKNLVTIMKTGFNSEDWIPPLLYFYEKFNTQDLGKFIVLLDNKFMGDWINRETPTKRLENMNKILKAIELAKNSNEVVENQELFEFDRERFFSEINGDIYGQRYCKYLLLKVENYKMASDMVFISNYKNISVEHILPQSPKAESLWRKEFTDDEREYWTNKLANLMLITRRKNSQLSNSEFKEKKERYSKENLTIFPSNNYIYLNTEKWSVSELKKRQVEINRIFGSQDTPEPYIKNTVIEEKSQADSEAIISEEKIENYPQEQDTKKKDTQKDRVINHILNSEIKLCDDCLSEELGITPRQTIYQIASSLKTDERFSREKTICDRCSGNKLVLMKK